MMETVGLLPLVQFILGLTPALNTLRTLKGWREEVVFDTDSDCQTCKRIDSPLSTTDILKGGPWRRDVSARIVQGMTSEFGSIL
jgi:hypothetical protein